MGEILNCHKEKDVTERVRKSCLARTTNPRFIYNSVFESPYTTSWHKLSIYSSTSIKCCKEIWDYIYHKVLMIMLGKYGQDKVFWNRDIVSYFQVLVNHQVEDFEELFLCITHLVTHF
jgi:hypothetical protein